MSIWHKFGNDRAGGTMTRWKDIKTSIRRRFEFIEFQLNWEGSIGRKKLQDQFSISLQQATNDLNSYLDACPENMLYDPRRKAYVQGSSFCPSLMTGEVSEYLMHLDMLHRGYRNESEIWIETLPTFDAVSVQTRKIDPRVFKTVLSAIRARGCITARYVSLSSDNLEPRQLKPHAIASDGHRWHVRAFDFSKRHYSDFVLSRLESPEFFDPLDQEIPEDTEWIKDVEVNLRADPNLKKNQRERLELEYGMTNGILRLKVRQAMLWYYLRHYGFNPNDLDGDAFRNRSSFHLKVSNLKEVERCLGRRS